VKLVSKEMDNGEFGNALNTAIYLKAIAILFFICYKGKITSEWLHFILIEKLQLGYIDYGLLFLYNILTVQFFTINKVEASFKLNHS